MNLYPPGLVPALHFLWKKMTPKNNTEAFLHTYLNEKENRDFLN